MNLSSRFLNNPTVEQVSNWRKKVAVESLTKPRECYPKIQKSVRAEAKSENSIRKVHRPACCFYLAGKCTFESCVFWHPKENVSPSLTVCKYGASCFKSHGQKVSSLEVCKVFFRFNCFTPGSETEFEEMRSLLEKSHNPEIVNEALEATKAEVSQENYQSQVLPMPRSIRARKDQKRPKFLFGFENIFVDEFLAVM
eukprot:GHVP01024697.1.p1 GENE.GHVP01024697.1~~GHVP01024697.1.p1  ORF type:complete len:204 (+),score=24.47 GHVP01024697.1:23-613(+)